MTTTLDAYAFSASSTPTQHTPSTQVPDSLPPLSVTLMANQQGTIAHAEIRGDNYKRSLELDRTHWTRLVTNSEQEEQHTNSILRRQLLTRLKRDVIEQLGLDFPDTTLDVSFTVTQARLSGESINPERYSSSRTAQELEHLRGELEPLPADLSQSSSSSFPQFKNSSEQSTWGFQEKAVDKTQKWVSAVKEKAQFALKAGGDWFDSLKEGVKSDSSQDLLQEMKDNISQRVERLGNNMALLPHKMATQALMKEVSAKFEAAVRYNGESPVQMGEYTVEREGNRFTLSTPSQEQALVFDASQGPFGQTRFEVRGQAPSLNPSDVLKRIRSFSPEESPSEARGLIKQAINHHLDDLKPGTAIGQWTTREYQGVSVLDNGRGQLLSSQGLDQLDLVDLRDLKDSIEGVVQQQALTDNVKVLGQVIGIVQKERITDQLGTYQIDFDSDAMTVRFETNGESFTAQSKAGQWQLVEGELSSSLQHKIQGGLKPKVEAHFAHKEQQKQKQQQFDQLANVL